MLAGVMPSENAASRASRTATRPRAGEGRQRFGEERPDSQARLVARVEVAVGVLAERDDGGRLGAHWLALLTASPVPPGAPGTANPNRRRTLASAPGRCKRGGDRLNRRARRPISRGDRHAAHIPHRTPEPRPARLARAAGATSGAAAARAGTRGPRSCSRPPGRCRSSTRGSPASARRADASVHAPRAARPRSRRSCSCACRGTGCRRGRCSRPGPRARARRRVRHRRGLEPWVPRSAPRRLGASGRRLAAALDDAHARPPPSRSPTSLPLLLDRPRADALATAGLVVRLVVLIGELVAHVVDGLRSAQPRLAEAAQRDELTGIGNRRLAMESLRPAAHAATPCWCSTSTTSSRSTTATGTPRATRCSPRSARLLRDTLRGADAIARLGGEEFVVLLRGGGRGRAGHRRAHPAPTGGPPRPPTTLSIGVAVLEPGEAPQARRSRAPTGRCTTRSTAAATARTSPARRRSRPDACAGRRSRRGGSGGGRDRRPQRRPRIGAGRHDADGHAVRAHQQRRRRRARRPRAPRPDRGAGRRRARGR